jgi:predicted RNase H-like nuclease (RuvC/YqgF family)
MENQLERLGNELANLPTRYDRDSDFLKTCEAIYNKLKEISNTAQTGEFELARELAVSKQSNERLLNKIELLSKRILTLENEGKELKKRLAKEIQYSRGLVSSNNEFEDAKTALQNQLQKNKTQFYRISDLEKELLEYRHAETPIIQQNKILLDMNAVYSQALATAQLQLCSSCTQLVSIEKVPEHFITFHKDEYSPCRFCGVILVDCDERDHYEVACEKNPYGVNRYKNIPCEHCQEEHVFCELWEHENDCSQNPLNQ